MAGRRGILGVKKDPKHQVLFMYNGEEWASSDSDDTDYEPGGKLPLASLGDLDTSEDSLTDSSDSSPVPRKRFRSSADGLNTNTSARSSQRQRREKRIPLPKPTRPRSSKTSKGASHCNTTTTTTTSDSHCGASLEDGGAGSGVVGMSWAGDTTPVGRLPVEVWMKIFHLVVRADGAVPFLCRAAKVCRQWQEMTKAPSLWRKVDLSYGWIRSTDDTLKRLARNNLSQCREINLSGWKNVTNDAVKELSERCPQLEAVNLSLCRKLSSVSVTALADGCPKLRRLDLSSCGTDAVALKCLKYLINKVESLWELSLGGNTLVGSSHLMNHIMLNCRSLDTLDLSNCRFTTGYLSLNVDKLQESCPSLRILRLVNCELRSTQDNLHCRGVGFTRLEELGLGISILPGDGYSARGVSDSLLIRFLHKASKLRLLDLRGCSRFSARLSLFRGPPSDVLNLESLYLASSSIGQSAECLADGLRQWRHSLRVLDLSWTYPPSEDLELALQALTDFPACPLTHLHLQGSSATLPCVRMALAKLPHLESLNLASCRALPRGIKCLYTGPAALNKLRASLLAHNAAADSHSDTDSYEMP